MKRIIGRIAAVVLIVVLCVAGLYAYRSFMLWDGRTPEGYKLLTRMPDATSFEPTDLPSEPQIESQSPTELAFNFGYKVGAVPYSYSLVLDFPRDAETGRAVITSRHDNRSATIEKTAVRRWDEPRKAFAVALTEAFDTKPRVPALCIKAVIGPSKERYDLSDSSICVTQLDGNGECHPETLACGLIRP